MQDILETRRARVAEAWGLDDEIALVVAGEEVHIPGRGDQVYPFRSHSEYFYLTDRDRPRCILAFDPRTGWVDFVPRITAQERVWVGGAEDEGVALEGLAEWLGVRAGRRLALLGVGRLTVDDAPPAGDETLAERLRETLTHVRRPKDEAELTRMRAAASATAAGFAVLPDLIREGATERAIQIELEAAFFRAGGDRTAYDTIVGSGPNSAVLHFLPTRRPLRDGELVLVDAGAEVAGYACDVTRTYPVGGRFTAEQRALYDLVRSVEEACIAMCRAGTEYRDIHQAASVGLAGGLVDFGLLRGDAAALVESGAHALFFPHGIGHMVGLGVRDASGRLPGRMPSDRPGKKHLRLDLPLEQGYVLTIEPGLYFIPALIDDPELRDKHRDEVDWGLADRLRHFGGIRIEDNVLVTAGDPEILTADIAKD